MPKSMCLLFFYYFFYHSINTLEHTLIFMKCMINEHVFKNFMSLSNKIQPSLILRLHKIVRVLRISITRINWDNQCSIFVAPTSPARRFLPKSSHLGGLLRQTSPNLQCSWFSNTRPLDRSRKMQRTILHVTPLQVEETCKDWRLLVTNLWLT